MSDWLTYSPSSGYGNGTITITAATQTELADRIKTIVAKNEYYGLSASTVIEQRIPDREDYLTFDVISGSNVTIWLSPTIWVTQSSPIYYKKNDGPWTCFFGGEDSNDVYVNAGDVVKLKGNLVGDEGFGYKFVWSPIAEEFTPLAVNVYGNIMSLVSGDDFSGLTTAPTMAFYLLFEDFPIIDASGLLLPTASPGCYSCTFHNCTKLTTAPELPATTLGDGCYFRMFEGCTSLTTAPELPATTLATGCYKRMFEYCYSLTTAPELPATTLAEECYYSMFESCTALTTAPELPAIVLPDYCYSRMFYDCISLNYIKCLATDNVGRGCEDWVKYVAASGTFVKNADMNDWRINNFSGIPPGWTVIDDGQLVVTAITLDNLTWTTNIPAGGGFATSANCSFNVIVHYSGGTTGDVTSQAVVNGSEIVSATTITSAHTAGTLTLTASYSGYSSSASTTIYQDAYVPTVVTGISLNNLTWVINIPAEGGIATSANCTYTVTAYYNNGTTSDITSVATVSGSESVPSSQITSVHTAGTLTLTASYEGYSASASVTIYQDGYVLSITGISFDNLTWVTDVPASGGTATSANCSYNVFVNFNDGSSADVTSQAVVIGSQNVEASQITTVHTAGTLTLTASYSTFLTSATVTIYQDAKQGSLSDYLTFDILTGGTLYFKTNYRTVNPTIYYRKNGGSWVSKTPVTGDTSYVAVESGDTIEFKSSFQGGYDNYYCYFSASTGTKFNARGNIMSLIGGDNFSGLTSVGYMTLQFLFSGCTTSLIDASQMLLPATTLGNGCYRYMFYNCSALTAAPELPATTLANYCYGFMFAGCTSLTTAPELPVTTLAEYCYRGMFQDCTSLTTAPELPATTLASNCYSGMFYFCTNLNYIKCLATDITANYCTSNWLMGVSQTGTFVKNPSMSSWTTGSDGIPSGWTVQDAT